MEIDATTPQRIDYQDFEVCIDRKCCVELDRALGDTPHGRYMACPFPYALKGEGNTPLEALNDLKEKMSEKLKVLMEIVNKMYACENNDSTN